MIDTLHADSPRETLRRLDSLCEHISAFGKVPVEPTTLHIARYCGGPLLQQLCEIILGYQDITEKMDLTLQNFESRWSEKGLKIELIRRRGMIRIFYEIGGYWNIYYNAQTGQLFNEDDNYQMELLSLSLTELAVGLVAKAALNSTRRHLNINYLRRHVIENPNQWRVLWDGAYLDESLRLLRHIELPIIVWWLDPQRLLFHCKSTDIPTVIKQWGTRSVVYEYRKMLSSRSACPTSR